MADVDYTEVPSTGDVVMEHPSAARPRDCWAKHRDPRDDTPFYLNLVTFRVAHRIWDLCRTPPRPRSAAELEEEANFANSGFSRQEVEDIAAQGGRFYDSDASEILDTVHDPQAWGHAPWWAD